MFYNARWYDPGINQFVQADTLIPNPHNSLDWNRYSYARNNPLRYIDPSGHASICMDGEDVCYDQEKRQWRGDINWGLWGPHKSKPKPSDSDEDGCITVSCKAQNGDVSAILDLLRPTHGGLRVQLEISFLIFSISGGSNIIYNRNDRRLGANIDFTTEAGPPPLSGGAGASLTIGPVFGWGSSSIDDAISGDSYIVSGTAAYEGALSVSVSTPSDGFLGPPKIDPVYGTFPATVYAGGGVGYAYYGLALGSTHSILHESFPFP